MRKKGQTSTKAIRLFSQGKSPAEVVIELDVPGSRVQQLYTEYWKLIQMHELNSIYREIKDSIGSFLKLYRLARKEGITPECPGKQSIL